MTEGKRKEKREKEDTVTEIKKGADREIWGKDEQGWKREDMERRGERGEEEEE